MNNNPDNRTELEKLKAASLAVLMLVAIIGIVIGAGALMFRQLDKIPHRNLYTGVMEGGEESKPIKSIEFSSAPHLDPEDAFNP